MPYDDVPADRPSAARRDALRMLGMGSLVALAGSALAGAARAELAAPSALTGVKLNEITLNRLSTTQISALRLSTRLPSTTPASQLGLTSEGVSMLTPAAKSLTKGDLEKLAQGSLSDPKLAALTVNDVNSIRTAFGSQYRPGAGASSAEISCCSCTPCCCAAAVSGPLALAA